MAVQKKRKKSKGAKIALFVVEILLLLVLVVVLWAVTRTTETKKININEEAIQVQMNEGVKENETLKGYRNIALFGVDSREGQLQEKTLSDTIIIASVNLDTKEVKLCSVYRDTYLNLTNGKYNKCNGAYSAGGAQQAIMMLNSNLDLDITDFVTIGFKGLKDTIDALGGVNIEVDKDELKHINNYQLSMVDNLGGSYTSVTDTGYQLLDGLQATAYCRIRYTAGNDFARAARQREVLQATLDVAKNASAAELTNICNNVFSEVYTSLDLAEILELLGSVKDYTIVDQAGFPEASMIATGTIGSKGSCVIPVDLTGNVKWLHEFLFDDDNYVPSEQIEEYSQEIFNQTNIYLNSTETVQ